MYVRKSKSELSELSLEELQVHMQSVQKAARASGNSDNDVAYMLTVRSAIAHRKIADAEASHKAQKAQNDSFLKNLDNLSRTLRNRYAQDADAKALRDALKAHFSFGGSA